MKRHGASIIFVNTRNEVLLFLRDAKPSIPYPGMWDVPGGHVEPGETPRDCIVREMREELGVDLEGFRLFCIREFADRIEHTFWKHSDLEIETIKLTEGQCLKWFSHEMVLATELAYGFNDILEAFFIRSPDGSA